MFFTFFAPLLFLFFLFLSSQTKTTVGFGNLLLGIFGVLGCLVGLILWLWGLISLGSSFSILPKAKKLKTGGAYKFFRHPIYLGIALSYLGISISLGSFWGLFYTIFIIIPLNIIRAKKEEKVLMTAFLKKYLEYRKKVVI